MTFEYNELMTRLTTGTAEERAQAIEALGDACYAPAVPHLTALVREADPGTRYMAAMALSKIGDEAETAVPALLEALRAEDIWLRMAVTSALIQIGDPAVPGLIRALFDDNKAVRRAAAKALGKIGDERAVSALTVTLKDGDSAVSKFSAEALRRIDTPAARAALDD
jgi:HEAT repeat protein